MLRYSLQIKSADSEIELEAPDIGAALAIIDINACAEGAEIWQGGERVARLVRCGASSLPFWMVV
ncbi:hypothetical protein [Qipengyuania oceanensis]|uniref:Uncharacterized protein n=1 Tax=Qipengyuania oceanensis TaxID=1463597 RepID=A0A844YIT4_9SPHN|nr:hypothetical protein [Qipengyuania oceanensis]MXO63847.1 hypothetical protein [Qipengyuania oceanensis]